MKSILFKTFFFAILSALFLSCGDDAEPEEMMEEEEQQEELTIFTTCRYSMLLDGVKIENEQTFTAAGITCNVVTGGSGLGNGYGASLFSNTGEESLDFYRGTIFGLQFFDRPTPEQFDSLFFVGEYEFTNGGDSGVDVTYTTPEDEIWSSSNDNADQSASKFELLEKVDSTVVQGSSETYVLNTRVKFNCNLYNMDGAVKKCEGTATFIVQNN